MAFKNQEIYSGYGSYVNIEKVLKENNAKKPLLVCDSAFDFLFIKDYFKNSEFPFVYFSDFTPNPLYEQVVEGVKLYRENNCDFIVSVGGGSSIDVAKCIKLYAKMSDDELYLKQEYTDTGIPHMAIPTTAGTGSESTRYAVCYYEGAKQSVTHESIIPDFVILEPTFLNTLPMYQKKATLLDALCQGIESMWSVNSTDESKILSEKAVKTILENLEAYLDGDKDATEKISVAANIAGKAINITQTTAAHAMSYKVTSLHKLAHGHAAAVCLSYVWRYMIDNIEKCSDPRGAEYLDSVFTKLDEIFCVDSHVEAVYRFFRILQYMEMPFPKFENDGDLDVLVKSVNPVRLKNNPIALDEYTIKEIYTHVYEDGNKFQKKNIEKFLKRLHLSSYLPELQSEILEILKTFDEFCKENGINYYLCEGTLLGAVRHNGFIPWDDDVDVCMKREDYDKFIALCKDGIADKLVLDCFETNNNHWTVCAKVQKKDGSDFTVERLRSIALSVYPSIDVFPLDAVSSEKNISSVFSAMKRYKTMLWLKTGYCKDYSTYKYAILKTASLFVPLGYIRKKLINLPKKAYKENKNDKYAIFGSLYGMDKECYDKELFDQTVEADFENLKLPIPSGYDEILKKSYGDYLELPSFSRRFPKHSYFVNKE